MDDGVQLFGIRLGRLPSWAILVIGVTGTFASFILQGTAQEAIFERYHFKDSLFLTFIQFLVYSSLSLGYFFQLCHGHTKIHAPIMKYFLCSVALISSTGLSNFSLKRISFPTQVLFRSSKLIPVMIGNIIFLKKRYGFGQIIAVILLVIGLVGISISDKLANNRFDIFGLIAVILSLVSDAFASNLEEQLLSHYKASQSEVIAFVYLFGSIEVGLLALITGEMKDGIVSCYSDPHLLFSVLLFSVLGAIGIQFVYIIIKKFGSLVAVMVTSLRKAFTVCLSFLLFSGKKFTFKHAISIGFISTGIYMNIIQKKKPKQTEEQQPLISNKEEIKE